MQAEEHLAIKDSRGMTALAIAAAAASPACVKLLLDCDTQSKHLLADVGSGSSITAAISQVYRQTFSNILLAYSACLDIYTQAVICYDCVGRSASDVTKLVKLVRFGLGANERLHLRASNQACACAQTLSQLPWEGMATQQLASSSLGTQH